MFHGFLADMAVDVIDSPLGRGLTMIPGVGTVVGTVDLAARALGGSTPEEQALVSQGLQANVISEMSGMLGTSAPAGASQLQKAMLLGATVSARARGGSVGLPMMPIPTDIGPMPITGGAAPGLSTPAANLEMTNTLPMTSGKMVLKPPRGYVTVQVGIQRMFMLRHMAIKQGLWKPARKPPISVRDWSCIQGASRVVKKLKTIEKKVKSVANFRAPSRRPGVKVLPHPHTVRLPANS